MGYIIPAISIILLTALDQFTKRMAFINLKGQGDITFIKGFLGFTYHENQGMAFGLFQGGRWIFLVMALIILGTMAYYYFKLGNDKVSKIIKGCMVLIAAGALGNSIDRLMNGYVIDFFMTEFMSFPIFNMADIYVVVGTVLMMIIVLFFLKDEEVKKDE